MLVSSGRNAVSELGDLPGMTTWSYKPLMDHQNEITRCRLSKAEDARPDKWTSVACAKQDVRRAGTKAAFSILNRCQKCGRVPKNDIMLKIVEEGACEIAQSAHCRALSEHETSMVTRQCGDEDETCTVYQADYPPQGACKSVMEALIMGNNVHKEDAGSLKMGSHRRVYGSLRSRTL